jgi:hypothetical protein
VKEESAGWSLLRLACCIPDGGVALLICEVELLS